MEDGAHGVHGLLARFHATEEPKPEQEHAPIQAPIPAELVV